MLAEGIILSNSFVTCRPTEIKVDQSPKRGLIHQRGLINLNRFKETTHGKLELFSPYYLFLYINQFQRWDIISDSEVFQKASKRTITAIVCYVINQKIT